jgi:DNA-binding transcriptional MerR regulator/DNA-directed RNA polymerase subunit RPC12/RpoP
MSQYTTGEVAKLCGVSVRTVQYYDTRGVVCPSELSEGGRRLYTADDVRKMQIVCYLRELGCSLGNIEQLMKEDDAAAVIDTMLGEQERVLSEEIDERQTMLRRLRDLRTGLSQLEHPTVESIGDVAHVMKNKKELRRIRLTMLLSAIPLGVLQWGSIIEWIMTGVWWPFVVYLIVAIPWGILVSRYYFRRVAYICSHCHHIFRPKFGEVLWANHTPNTRKLTCPACGIKSFCVETAAERAEERA